MSSSAETNTSEADTHTSTDTPTAAVDEHKIETMFGPPPDNGPEVSNHKPGTHRHGRRWGWPLSKKQWVVYSSILVIVIGGGVLAYAQTRPEPTPPPPPPKPAVYVPPKPTTVPSTLTGLPVDPSVNKRPVTAVMVENSLDARPQSGLDQAGVVFEAIAEGGITRFMGLFQDTQPDYIGPVRSSRPYYLEWALPFQAGYAHVGGSPEALRDIKSWGVRDLDQFYNSGAYHRISTRYAPHNVYTSIANLNKVETAKGYATSSFTGFARKAESPSKTPNATSITMTFSGYYYNTSYTYDTKTNSYKRDEAGKPHMMVDAQGHQIQLTPKVVIALIMPYSHEADGYHSQYQTIGSGQMFVFQDGTVQQGTWTKASRTDQFHFTDAQGHALELNPGQTWISALGSASDVSYK